MKKVLLVYDREVASQAHSTSLYYQGVYPLVSNQIDEAYELICYNKFDLIIIDFLEDINKVKEVLKKIEPVRRDAKIIVSVSSNYGQLDTELKELGANEVVQRVSEASEFLENLRDSLDICRKTSWVSGEFHWSK